MSERVYLDTTIISAYFDQRVPVRLAVTQAFWAQACNEYEMWVSTVTLAELERTPSETRRAELSQLVASLPVMEPTEASDALAQRFLDENVIPPRKREDAQHLALAVEGGFDYLVSWNFRHMVNVKIQRRLPLISAQHGYFRPLTIASPQAFIGSNEL